MAKIVDADRARYLQKIKPYRANAETILKYEHEALAAIPTELGGAAFMRLDLVDAMLNLASNYLVCNGVSLSILKVKDEDALNDARKSLYKSVIYLEGVVSDLVDAPYSEYEERLAAIASIDAARRYLLVRKMGMAIALLENAYGDNTKWRWAFVELEGRYAATAKNIIDLRNVIHNTDPRSPNYEPTVYHLRLIQKLLMRAADRYRERYELSTNRIDDFKKGIAFLSALKRLHVVTGDRDDAAELEKKLEFWNLKLEADSKRTAVPHGE
jgi:hypothetical protein